MVSLYVLSWHSDHTRVYHGQWASLLSVRHHSVESWWLLRAGFAYLLSGMVVYTWPYFIIDCKLSGGEPMFSERLKLARNEAACHCANYLRTWTGWSPPRLSVNTNAEK